jgi:hypothetical protein
MFGDTESSDSEDILTLINDANLENPSDDFKLKLSNISQTELNNLFTKNQIDNDKIVPLIKILDESQIKSIVNILNQKQLETILKSKEGNVKSKEGNENIIILLENINKEQTISIADKDAITNLIIFLLGIKMMSGKEIPNLKFITISQFNLLIDNDIPGFINKEQNIFFIGYLIKEFSKNSDLILINHIINLLMALNSDAFVKITNPFFFSLNFNILYYLLSNHGSLVNNKFDHLFLSMTLEQIKFLDLSKIDEIYDSPIMNKLSSISQDFIKSVTIKLIPAIKLPNASITWTIVKRNNYNCIATNSTGQYLTACNNDLIYSSSDYGKSWLEYEYPKTIIMNMSNPDKFMSIGSDETGKYLVASANMRLYLSSDFGVSWKLSSAPSTNIMWTSVTSDSTGKYLAACASPAFIDNSDTISEGGVYTSQDFGITWKLTSLPTNIQILSIQSNITGKYLFVCTNTSLSYLSNDYGNGNIEKWTEISSPIQGFSVTSVVINFDGSQIIGVVDSKGLFKYSNSRWGSLITELKLNFNSVSSDTSGKYIVASGLNGIYESSDYGSNWILSYNKENNKTQVLSNHSGNQIIAINDSGLYIGKLILTPSATTSPSATTHVGTTSPSATTLVTYAPQSSGFILSNNNMIIIIAVVVVVIVLIIIVIVYNNYNNK